MVLLIDSLDQLDNENSARGDLSFLKNVKPHKDSVIIVSALPDQQDPITKQWQYCYGCDTRLKEADVPRVTVGLLGDGTDISSVRGIRTHQLDLQGRGLTDAQWGVAQAQAVVEPTALYAAMAVRVLKSWTSDTQADPLKLTGGVRPLINQLLETVEEQYGKLMTRAALGFITFSVDGISNTEMEDLLSLHPGVMSAEGVNQYNTTARLPGHVWLRLRGEMEGLVVEKIGGRLGWYHRQLKESAEERYGKPVEEKAMLHVIMAQYFGNLVLPELKHERGISTQPLLLVGEPEDVWVPAALVNERRCVEAAAHMLQAHASISKLKGTPLYSGYAHYDMLGNVEVELCSIDSIWARAKAGQIFSVVSQLSELSELSEKFNRVSELVDHYLRWVRLDATLIHSNPQHFVPASCSALPIKAIPRKALKDKTNSWVGLSSVSTSACCDQTTWINTSTMGTTLEFENCLLRLHGHTSTVTSVSYSTDGTRIVSGSYDKTVRIWDAVTGQLYSTLEGHASTVNSVSYSTDGTRIVSGLG